MAIEIKRLGYFIQIAESGSLSKAAEVLYIAQPALSRQIHILEDYLGFPLFVRTGRGMKLTKEGGYLRDAVMGPLRDIELAVENMRSFLSREFTFGLGIHPGLSTLLASPLLAALESEVPNARFQVLEGPSNSLLEWLKQGTIDFALLDYAFADDGLSFRMLTEEDLVLVRTAGNNSPQRLALNKLAKLPFVLPCTHQGARKIIDKAAQQAGLTLNVIFETDSIALMCDLAKKGRGNLLISRSQAKVLCAENDDLVSANIRPAPQLGTYLATRSYGAIEGSLIAKIDSTIEAVVTAQLQ